VEDQFQTDIPKVKPFTRRFRVHVGTCAGCGRRVQGRHELQSSDALGAASVQIGPHALALAAQMNKELGITYGKLVTFFRTAFGLELSRATACRANERLAAKASPTYERMAAAVRSAPAVYSDETGWRIAGRLAWLWAFVTEEITLFAIRRCRGFPVVAEIVGKDFAGLFGRDGWAAYRKLTAATHQTCNGHLLRRAHDLHETSQAGEARFPLAVKRVLQEGLALRDRRDEMSAHGFAVARGRLEARLDRILAGRIEHAPNARFQRHLVNERDAIFTYLYHPEIEATTWMPEQEIRPGVVNRKTSGGSRSERGAEAQAILPSLFRTARRQGREPVALMVKLLRAPHPVDLGLARGRVGRSRIAELPGVQARASPAA
jgi:transposase